jgi:uncharacterized protein (DUF4213/DUF364 family)
MALLEDLVKSVEHTDAVVREIIVGRQWTLAVTETEGPTGSYGLAASPLAGESTPFSPADPYRGTKAATLLRLASSRNPMEASIGIATLNSLLTGGLDAHRFRPRTVPRATGKRVVVAGDFPFTDDLRAIAEDLQVIDWIADPSDRPDDQARRLIASADIAVIRGSAILEGTLEPFLELARPCFTIVYGPSTPLSPILFAYGADQLVGVRVKDLDAAKNCITDSGKEIMKCPGLETVVLASAQVNS